MNSSSGDMSWPEIMIVSVVIGGFLVFIVVRLIITRGQGSATDPLPRLDPVARDAIVVGTHSAPRQIPKRHRRSASIGTGNHDAWLVEVEYVDAVGKPRRACLADVIPTVGLDRFSVGAACRVYGFDVSHTRFQTDAAPEEPATERCLLTEEHDGVQRAGFDLDGVRARFERQIWPAPRAGSPFLGVMAFVTDGDPWQGEVAGCRTSFPGDARTVWARASTGRVSPFRGPRDVPRPESVEEVAKWEDPNGFGRTELYYAPIFWVCIPFAALGFLIWGLITDPGAGLTGNLFDDDSTGNLWNFWLVWVFVAVWLFIAIGILLLRVGITSEVRADNEWIYRHGVPCSIHLSPFARSGGEGESWPTFIGIDHRLSDEHAARIHQAFHNWLSDPEVQGELDSGSLQTRNVIASEELFGGAAVGGYYLSSLPGFGSASDFAAHEWALLTVPREAGGAMSVTTVPRDEKRAKIRRKIRAKSARI
ncbi:hypothetical protein [Microbacterium sp.]|uniref:hypothetical protein n=1 Tax=Microbacterium sp. TaxID=51671 RepID=UPI003F98F03E